METIITDAEEKRYAELQLLAIDAARTGDSPTLASMVRAGLPVNLQDFKDNTAADAGELPWPCRDRGGFARLRGGAGPGQTPLGGVAFKGYLEVATLLLDAGADLNADQGGGTTPLMLASLFGRTEMVRLLKQRGADAKTRNRWGISAGLFDRLFRIIFKVRHPFQAPMSST